MHQSKLIRLLKQCSTHELKLFKKFVHSPYFNTNSSIIELYQLLRKAAPDFSPKRVDKFKLFQKLYPNAAFSEKRIGNLMSELVKLLELFWQMENLQTSPIQQQIDLAHAYQQHGLLSYWQQNIDRAEKVIQNKLLEAADYYHYQLLLNLEKHQVIEDEGQRNQEPNLQAVNNHLDTYFLCNKLKYYSKVLNYQGFKSHSYDIRMIDVVLQEASCSIYQNEPAIQIYYHGVRTRLSLEHEDSFKALKKLLTKHCHDFALAEVQNMFMLARNFCIKQMNSGIKEKYNLYARELLSIYQIEINEELILDKDVLPPATCKNIIATANLLSELEWAVQFLVQFKSKMDSNSFNFNMATIRFQQGKFKRSLELLQQTHFTEVLLLLATKGLILKTYYELYITYADNFDYEDQLDLYIQSFSVFLKRKKEVLTKRYVYYDNMVSIVKQLFNLSKELDLADKKIVALQEKLKHTKSITEKAWLKRKLMQMMK